LSVTGSFRQKKGEQKKGEISYTKRPKECLILPPEIPTSGEINSTDKIFNLFFSTQTGISFQVTLAYDHSSPIIEIDNDNTDPFRDLPYD
jgi:hypothetical protein